MDVELKIYRCECGKEFEKSCQLTAHGIHCNKFIPRGRQYKAKSKSKYKIDDNLYRCECGREFDNHQSINGHFRACKIHCTALGKDVSKMYSHKGTMNWEKKTPEEIKAIHKKSGKTRSENIQNNPDKHGSFYGRQLTQEHKDKIRETVAKRIIKLGHRTNFSKRACDYIDNLNKEKNWNLQHALNGGEKFVKGYFVDGYDKNLNIVFEYDEAAHYKDIENNILRDKDIIRQNTIIEELNCEFWRYNEYLDLLYKAN